MTTPTPTTRAEDDLVTPEQATAMLAGATEGPWRADGEPWNRIVWSGAENRVCFMAHTNGLDDARDIATSNLVAAAPDLARTVIALHEALAAERARADEAYEKGMDDAADKILAWLAKAVGGEDYTPCDGTEEWDGDVHGSIYNILKAGNVYDDEDGRVARLTDGALRVAAEARVAEAIERARDGAYAGGWSDGYAEGYGKAAALAVDAFPKETAYGRGGRARITAALEPGK